MIYYNPKLWFSFIFKIDKADTLRKLFPLIISVAAYAGIVTFLLLDVLHVTKDTILTKVIYIHQTIGFVFSLLLAFRINSAYDRWWEGRKIWGSLTNNSRNLAIKLKHLVDAESASFFNFAIPLYGRALRDHLRGSYTHDEQNFIAIDGNKHVPNQVASSIIKEVYRLNKSGQINPEQLVSITAEITSFTDICGACERIKKTPIPFSYSVFIKKFIFTYIVTLPFTWAFDLKYFIMPIIGFILFVFASIELIAEEIEDPFGIDANDLPLDNICENIEKHVGEIFCLSIMLKIAYDPIYAHPLPPGHRFPMLKYELIPAQLLHEGVIADENIFSPNAVDESAIVRTHNEAYWHQLRDLTLPPKEQRRIGFPLSAQLIEREMRIAQGTINGCRYAAELGISFNVAGGTHHAGSNWGEGFCMLNDQAIAANYLLENNLAQSILIIDLDVHQGNGTAEIFEKENRVFTFSMHGDKNFPFRKEHSDLDIPLDDGTNDELYLNLLKNALPELIDKQKPDFIFYLAGVDILASDKLGKLSLTKEGCKERDKFVFEQCRQKQIPVQVSMGGGYSPDIRDIVEAHCNTYKIANELYF